MSEHLFELVKALGAYSGVVYQWDGNRFRPHLSASKFMYGRQEFLRVLRLAPRLVCNIAAEGRLRVKFSGWADSDPRFELVLWQG